MLTRAIAGAALATLLIIASTAPSVAWTGRGLPVCAAEFEQTNPMMVSDGAGGAIVVWEDYRSYDWNIYAQRIDGAGMPLWTVDGLAIVSASGADSLMQVVAGGAGEAIILWKHGTSMYAQKIDAAGTKLWTSGGKRIYTNTAPPFSPHMITDGGGGAIVAWIETRSGTKNVYAQRLAHDGTIMWTDPGGITVSAAAGNESQLRIASDGMGGVLVTFVNNATATPNVYVQRVRSSGAIWGSGGVAVGTNVYPRLNPAIASDGDGGAIVAWEIGPSGDAIAALRIYATGALAWGAGGVFICYVDESQTAPEIIEDGAGGAVVVWRDERSLEPQLFAQKLDRYGQAIWTADGVQVFERWQDSYYYRLLAAGGGRVFVVYDDQAGNDIRGGILNLAGGSEWDEEGVPILNGEIDFGEYGAIPDGAGGLLVTVANDAGFSQSIDIVAQGINRFGRVSVPEPRILDVSDVPDDQGGNLRIRVSASDRDSIGVFDGAIASYDVWQRIDDASALAELRNAADREVTNVVAPGVRLVSHKGRRFIEAAPAGIFPEGSWEYVGGFDATQSQEYVYRATTIADSSSAGPQYSVYVVSAHSADPAVWFASEPDSGYSVDNLAPGVPEGFAGEQGYSPAGLSLTWSLGAENDLSHYAVYRGTSEDFVPDPGTLAATPAEPEWFDGEWRWDSGYYYKVAAVDVHENESGYALLRPDDVTGSDSPRAPAATYLAQNFPNPFNPATKIAFGLKGPAAIKLGVYDASGRLVRMLVEGARPAGHYNELWDGRNARGAAVASGIYFYRLDAGAFCETRKMVIMR